MKLFEITDPLADDSDYVLNPEHKKEAILYIWNQLYWKWVSIDHPISKQKAKDKLIKGEHLWAKVPYCAYLYARDIIQGKFPEGEAIIGTDLMFKRRYEHKFNCKLP